MLRPHQMRAHAGSRALLSRLAAFAVALPAVTACGGRLLDEPASIASTGGIARTEIGGGKVLYSAGGDSLLLDNRDPQVPADVQQRVVEVFFAAYARMRARFNNRAPRTVLLVMDTMAGRSVPAVTAGNTITLSSRWIRDHPFDVDIVTHEAFHVAQAYPPGDTPRWAVEGLADYGRHVFGLYNQAAGWSLPAYSPQHSYQDGYRATARFFVWLESNVRPGVLEELDAALRAGRYSALFWKNTTGRSIDELWAEYARQPGL